MLREWLTGLKARDRIKPYTSTKAQILVALVGCKLDWRNKQTQNIKSKQTKKEKNKKKRKSKKMYWQWFGERHPISKVTEEQVNLLGFDTGAHGLSEHYKH